MAKVTLQSQASIESSDAKLHARAPLRSMIRQIPVKISVNPVRRPMNASELCGQPMAMAILPAISCPLRRPGYV
jgi:hypothetical protein